MMDLIDDIKKAEAMIKLHSADSSAMMLDQYKYKRYKLTGFLIDDLVDPEFRSAKSMHLIKIVIEKFYPNLKNEAQADITHEALNELEAVLG